ncbi:MAG: tape measure protein [Azoarcus sp.]|jgi:tape measure domain-containing protein|nr:tape measure protein [Azoarcus sp.]
MAGNLTFGIRINADGAQAAQQLRVVSNAANDAGAAIASAGQAAARSSREIDGMTGAVKHYAAAFAGAISAGKLIQAADEWGQLASRIQIAAGSADLATEATARLMEVSNRSYKSFGNSAELYIRTSQSLTELGYSADTALGMVEALQYGLTVSGANAERSANVIAAWSKSINQGKMNFEEFQSVLNGAPRLVQALADSLGKSTVELQAMVREGKITADVLIGVGSQVGKLGEEADKMPVTLSDAFTRAQNSLMQFAGSAEQNHGVVKALTSGITTLADNIDLVAAAVGVGAVAAFGRFTGATIASTRAMAGKVIAARQLATGLASLTVAQRAAALASASTGAAIAALGGPIGLLITALGAAAIAWTTFGDRAESAADRTRSAIDKAMGHVRQLNTEMQYGTGAAGEMREALEKLDKRLELLGQSRSPMAREEITKLLEQRKEIESALQKIENGGMDASAASNARYAKYMSERRSLSEQRRAELDEEQTAFDAATRNYQKTDAEYIAALEAHNRKVAEIQEKYKKKAPKSPREKKPEKETDYEVSLQQDMGKTYGTAMEQLISAQRQAESQALGLTSAQQTLRDLMLSPQWAEMPQPWRDVVQAQVDATEQAMTHADAMATYKQAMDSISASVAEARKSTMDLDAAMSELYDLMASPAWGQMSEAARVNAVEQATAASNVIKKAEESKNKMGFSSLQQDISRSVSSGLLDGFSNGDSLAKSLGSSLQNALLNYSQKGLEEGISKALDIASDWIADLFSSMSSSMSSAGGSGGGWGSIFSAIGAWFASAQGNAFTSAGPVRAFARGGAFGPGEILTKPTFFRFASGGAWRNGVAGEAGPEAALPLKRLSDGTLGVATDGGGNGPVTINVVVNTDGSGSSAASGDGAYEAMAWRIGKAAAREVLIEEKRAGGQLAGG